MITLPIWLVTAGKAVGGFLRAIPWQAWLVAAVLLVGWRYGEMRYDAGVAACEARVATAVVKAEQTARAEEQRQSGVSAAATQAKDERLNEKLPAIEGRTYAAIERVRIIYRDRPVPADCARPDSVRAELEAARQRANAAGGGLRGRTGGADPADPKRPEPGS